MPFSDKQIDFIKNSDADINICSGSVRSGKTFANNVRFLHFLETQAIPRVDCLITGKTGNNAERNVVNPFLDLAIGEGLENQFRLLHNPRKLIYLPKQIDCILAGGQDAGSEPLIRGMTSQAWLGDEVTTYPKDFSMQCVARCSAGNRFKWLTTNPDSPSHYIKTDFIDKIESGKIDGRVWYWNIEKDNPALWNEEGRKYIEQLKSLYSGVFYDRFILGRWVLAEGVIYDKFRRDEHIVDSFPVNSVKEYILGIDWGYAKDHPLAILLIAVTDHAYYVIDEIYTEKQLINDSLKELMIKKEWFNLDYVERNNIGLILGTYKGLRPSYAYADNARPDCIQDFYNLTNIPTLGAFKDVNDGILHVQEKFVKKDDDKYGIYILKNCVNTIRELELYRWDTVASQGLGKDTPVKRDDHCPDALRYAIFTRECGKVKRVDDFRR
jgi:PBSX family phage terminase large subunit